MAKWIELTKGKRTLVDDEDYAWAKEYSWHLHGKAAARAWRISKTKVGHLKLHREILRAGPGQLVDHINGDSLDNRRSNLRLATPGQNMYNRRKLKKGISKYKGVYRFQKTGKWYSQIFVNRVRYYLGQFLTEETAAKAYNRAAKKYFGTYANLNKLKAKLEEK